VPVLILLLLVCWRDGVFANKKRTMSERRVSLAQGFSGVFEAKSIPQHPRLSAATLERTFSDSAERPRSPSRNQWEQSMAENWMRLQLRQRSPSIAPMIRAPDSVASTPTDFTDGDAASRFLPEASTSDPRPDTPPPFVPHDEPPTPDPPAPPPPTFALATESMCIQFFLPDSAWLMLRFIFFSKCSVRSTLADHSTSGCATLATCVVIQRNGV
jgi:hypothetical protein